MMISERALLLEYHHGIVIGENHIQDTKREMIQTLDCIIEDTAARNTETTMITREGKYGHNPRRYPGEKGICHHT